MMRGPSAERAEKCPDGSIKFTAEPGTGEASGMDADKRTVKSITRARDISSQANLLESKNLLGLDIAA
jgi:hypothetical protein